MLCLQLEWTVSLLCLLSLNCNWVHAIGLCEYDDILASRMSSLSYSWMTSSEPNQNVTETQSTEYKLTLTSDPTTMITITPIQKSNTAEVQTTQNNLNTKQSSAPKQETTTKEIEITTSDSITSEEDSTKEIRTTEQIRSTANERTTPDYSSERKTTTEDFRATANDPITTEAYTSEQTATSGEHTTLKIHSTKHTTSDKTTKILSTKVTTTDLITNERTTTGAHTSDRETTEKGFQTTTYDPTITEAFTTEQTSTSGEHTTLKVHSTKHTTSEKTTNILSTKVTTTDLITTERTTTEAHTSDRETTEKGVQTTTYDPTSTEAFNTDQTSTTDEHTTLEIQSTQRTTSDKTTEILSTKVTTTDLTTFLPTTLLPCPTNMIYTNCTCQTTCEDPKRLNGCFKNCTGGELCICPDGFYLLQGNCVPPEECGCYVQNEDIIIQESDTQLVLSCTQQCSCVNNVLSCNNYQCDANALCSNRSGTFECHCEDGYHGNGVSCTRLTDCTDVYDVGLVDDGVYTILPTGWTEEAFEVYCKDGWNIFQRREDGSVDFYLYWADYKKGFGDPRGEVWLGLEKLFYLTNQGFYELKISLISDGAPHEIKHTIFRISNEADNYRLSELGSHTSTLGANLMGYHYTFQFSTRDRDNDNHPTVDCAESSIGAWWYKQCWKLNLNGPYGIPVEPGLCYNLNTVRHCNIPFTEMSIRRV